jgi:hypothetical protein
MPLLLESTVECSQLRYCVAEAVDSQRDESSLYMAALELDTPEYAGAIEQRMLLEKLLAQGGIRLAGLLNYLFADQGAAKGPFVMNPAKV